MTIEPVQASQRRRLDKHLFEDMILEHWCCTMSVYPHVYNVAMYVVKDRTPPPMLSQARPVLQYRPPLETPANQTSSIIFEFTDKLGELFRFPAFAVVESDIEGHTTASFLIVRRGSTGKSYKPDLDFYQPVSVRLSAESKKILPRLLSDALAPPDVVWNYLNDIMYNTTRAEYVLMAMQQGGF